MLMWWVEGAHNSCSSRRLHPANTSLNTLAYWGTCVSIVLREGPFWCQQGKERGFKSPTKQRFWQAQAARQCHCLFADLLGWQHCLLCCRGNALWYPWAERCAFPAGKCPPDHRPLMRSLLTCLVSVSGNLPFPLGQAGERCLCCGRLLISLLLLYISNVPCTEALLPLPESMFLSFFFFNCTCWPYSYILSPPSRKELYS